MNYPGSSAGILGENEMEKSVVKREHSDEEDSDYEIDDFDEEDDEEGYEADDEAFESSRSIWLNDDDDKSFVEKTGDEAFVTFPPLPVVKPFPRLLSDVERDDAVVEPEPEFRVDFYTYQLFCVKANAFEATIPIVDVPKPSVTELAHDTFVGQMTELIWRNIQCLWTWYNPIPIVDMSVQIARETTEEMVERIGMKYDVTMLTFSLSKLPELRGLGNSFFFPGETIYEYVAKNFPKK